MDAAAGRPGELDTWWKRAQRVYPYGVGYTTWAVPFPAVDDRFARLMLDQRGAHDVWRAEGRIRGQSLSVVGAGRSAVDALERLAAAVRRCSAQGPDETLPGDS